MDYTYQYDAAKAAKANGVKNYVLVSSVGANAKSKVFYTKMKGVEIIESQDILKAQ